MLRGLVALLAGLAALVAAASATSSGVRESRVIVVTKDAQLPNAVAALLDSGGTIVLRPGSYRSLTVPMRPTGAARLEIVGSKDVRLESVLLERTSGVSLRAMTISPSSHDARVHVHASTGIELDDLLVTARGTTHSASVVVQGGRGIAIRKSTFTHCGDRSPEFANCLRLFDGASSVLVENDWFHDCNGCDFVHGRPGSGLTVRHTRFERALPCSLGPVRCGHQDLIELFAGRWLRFEDNYFGVYRIGGAQLYLTGAVDHVSIVNNLFVGTDPRVPGYASRVALIVGSSHSHELPLHVTVANNTILTGARRNDGYAGSLRMSSHYAVFDKSARPIVANNVIALLGSRQPTCGAAQLFVANVVARGVRCSRTDRLGDPHLDAIGRPTFRSKLLIDRAAKLYAPGRDITERLRDSRPDIGAYEYREHS